MPSKYAIGVRGSARCERKYLEWRAEGGASRLATTTIAIMTASRITRRSRITGSKGPSLEQHFMRFCQQSVAYPLAARPMPGMHQRPEQRSPVRLQSPRGTRHLWASGLRRLARPILSG